MSFKGIKKILYATPMDVRILNSIFDIKKEDVAEDGIIQDITDDLIEQHLYDSDAFIRSFLSAYYSESSFINQTPYYKGPLSPSSNQGKIRCLGVTLGDDVITEQWTVNFGAPTGDDISFEVEGTFSGNQGSGNTGSNFTSTNGDLTINSSSWKFLNENDSAYPGDKVFIMSYISHPLIRTISSYLAASSIIDYLYSESEGSQSSWSKTYYKKAMDLLKLLSNPNSGIGLEGNVISSVDHEAVGYNIDQYGRDITKYRSITYDKLPFDNNSEEDY